MAATLGRMLILVGFIAIAVAAVDQTFSWQEKLEKSFAGHQDVYLRVIAPLMAAAKTEQDIAQVQKFAKHLSDAKNLAKWQSGEFDDPTKVKTLFQIAKEAARGHEQVIEAALRPFVLQLPQGQAHLNTFMAELRSDVQNEACGLCRITMTILKLASIIFSWSSLRDTLNIICIIVIPDIVPSLYRSDYMCPGIIDLQGPVLYNILRGTYAKPVIPGVIPIPEVDFKIAPSPLTMCQFQNLCFPPTEEAGKPRSGKSEVSRSRRAARRAAQREQGLLSPVTGHGGLIHIAQIADVHVDPDYAQGSLTDCGLPVCCVMKHGTGDAGHWGDYRCNIPKGTVDHMFDFVKSISPTYAIYSGDSPPHSMWEETQASQLKCTEEVVDSFTRKMPGIPVFPTIGNHEMYPTNVYSMNFMDGTKEMVPQFVEMWSPLANFTSAEEETMRTGGYYSKLIRPGLRILSYNTEYMYTMNWMNVHNDQQNLGPAVPVPERYNKELQAMKNFMTTTLAEAKTANEKVIMSGHHPTGSADYLVTVSKWLTELILTYHDIIVLHTAGHTHRDDFRLIIDPASGEAKSVVNLGPTMTSMGGTNPAVRMWHLNDTTFKVQHYADYYFDIIEAGTSPDPPTIRLAYQATEEYEMADLSPASWQDLADRMENDNVMLQKFVYHYHNHARPNHICDDACRIAHLCRIRNPTFDAHYKCRRELLFTNPTPTPATDPPPTCPPSNSQAPCRCPLA